MGWEEIPISPVIMEALEIMNIVGPTKKILIIYQFIDIMLIYLKEDL